MLATLLCALIVERSDSSYVEAVHGLQVLLQLRLHSSDQEVSSPCGLGLGGREQRRDTRTECKWLAVTLLTLGTV